MRKIFLIAALASNAALASGTAIACDVATSEKLLRPATGDISSGFGMRFHPLLNQQKMHEGVDFAGAAGDPILAARGGRVVESGRRGYYGNYVRIDHGDGLATAYGQLAEILVAEGACVRAGDVIGKRGSTGLSSGPHLHFELRRGDVAVDPEPLLAPPKT